MPPSVEEYISYRQTYTYIYIYTYITSHAFARCCRHCVDIVFSPLSFFAFTPLLLLSRHFAHFFAASSFFFFHSLFSLSFSLPSPPGHSSPHKPHIEIPYRDIFHTHTFLIERCHCRFYAAADSCSFAAERSAAPLIAARQTLLRIDIYIELLSQTYICLLFLLFICIFLFFTYTYYTFS